MSQLGYYRYKLENVQASKTVSFYVNGIEAVKHSILVRPTCTGWKQLKWLDSNGQYRLFSFLPEHSIKDTPKSLGGTNEFITSLLASQTDSRNLGQSNERTMVLRAQNITAKEREILSGLNTSPLIYLYVGDFTKDESTDYVIVTVKGDGIVRTEKQKNGNFEITINLPKYNTITKL